MRLPCIGAFAGLVLAIASVPAGATEILSEEPHAGMLKTGETVFVESSKCPAGQVMSVSGGDRGARGGGQATPRVRKCVPRPQ